MTDTTKRITREEAKAGFANWVDSGRNMEKPFGFKGLMLVRDYFNQEEPKPTTEDIEAWKERAEVKWKELSYRETTFRKDCEDWYEWTFKNPSPTVTKEEPKPTTEDVEAWKERAMWQVGHQFNLLGSNDISGVVDWFSENPAPTASQPDLEAEVWWEINNLCLLLSTDKELIWARTTNGKLWWISATSTDGGSHRSLSATTPGYTPTELRDELRKMVEPRPPTLEVALAAAKTIHGKAMGGGARHSIVNDVKLDVVLRFLESLKGA